MAKPAIVLLLLFVVLARHACAQGGQGNVQAPGKVQLPDAYYVQIFPSNPATGPPLKLAEVQLVQFETGLPIEGKMLNFTFTKADGQETGSKADNNACHDGDMIAANCVGDPDEPSTLIIQFPDSVAVQQVVVQTAANDITSYGLKVVHSKGTETPSLKFEKDQKGSYTINCLDVASVRIQPRENSTGTAQPLVVSDIQLLDSKEDPVDLQHVKYTVQSIAKDNQANTVPCGDTAACYDGNKKTFCGACNPSNATSFTISYPPWVDVSEVKVTYNKLCKAGNATCKDPITDYVLQWIDLPLKGTPAIREDTAFPGKFKGDVFTSARTAGVEEDFNQPDSHYVQIFPKKPTAGPQLKLGEVQLVALDGSLVPREKLNFTFTVENDQGSQVSAKPTTANACNDGDKNSKCVGNQDKPSNLTVQFPSEYTVERVMVKIPDNCKDCDLTSYELKVVHSAGQEKLMAFNKTEQVYSFPCLGTASDDLQYITLDPTDLVSLNIQPQDSSVGTAAPLVVNEIQLLDSNKSVIARNLLKYTVLWIPKDNTTQTYVCGDASGCNDGNFQSTCGACNSDATNFTITYPTWVDVSEVQVSYTPCNSVGCNNSIADYVLRFIDQNQTATTVGTAFRRPPVNGSMFSILSTEWLSPSSPPVAPNMPPPPLPPTQPSPPTPPGPNTNVGLIVGLTIGGVVLLAAVAGFLIFRNKRNNGKRHQFIQDVQDVPVPHSPVPTGFYLAGRSTREVDDCVRNVVGKVKTMVKLDDNPRDYVMLPTFMSSHEVNTDAMLMRYSLQHQCYLWLLDNVWSDKTFASWRRQVQARTHQPSHSPDQMVVLVQPSPAVQEEDSMWHSHQQLKNGTAQVDDLISEAAAGMVRDLRLSPHSQPAVEKIILEALCLRFLMGSISASGSQVDVPGVRHGQTQLDPVRKLDDVHNEYSIAALVQRSAAQKPLYHSNGGVLYCLEPGASVSRGAQPWTRHPVVVALVP